MKEENFWGMLLGDISDLTSSLILLLRPVVDRTSLLIGIFVVFFFYIKTTTRSVLLNVVVVNATLLHICYARDESLK